MDFIKIQILTINIPQSDIVTITAYPIKKRAFVLVGNNHGNLSSEATHLIIFRQPLAGMPNFQANG